MYETFEHTADLGLRVSAESYVALLQEAALGLLSMVVADPSSVQLQTTVEIELPGDAQNRPEYLLFDWLSELLYRFETDALLLREFDIRITPDGLTATCRGEVADADRHQLEHEVKAITYHDLRVWQEAGEWHAELIVDI